MNLKKLIGGYPPKDINERIRESIRLRAPLQHFATLMVQEPDGIIKGISQSKPNNLILDNFGLLLARMFMAPGMTQNEITLVDLGGVNRLVQVWGDGTASDYSAYVQTTGSTSGTQIQLGSGVTAATRADYAIETALPTAPEDDSFDTGSGSYAAGSIGVAGVVVAGGAGNINEVLMIVRLTPNTGAAAPWEIALFHDILASTEAFVLGNTLTATYTITL